MKDETIKSKNRRQLLAGVARAAVLSVLSLAGGGLIAKRRRLVRQGKCINKSLCCGCNVFDECGLPAALSAKRAKGIS